MTEYQVRKYAHLIKTSWLKKGGIFFEQNQDNTHINLLFAQQILMSEFSHRTAINRGETLRNGYPNVWSNDFVTLHEKRRTVLAEASGPAPTETSQSFLNRAVRSVRARLQW